MKFIQKILKILLILLLVVIIILIGFFICHRIMLNVESKMLKDVPGVLVNVNGHNMHVYTEGTGDKTLVFMAGFGSACPYIEFKPLYQKLRDKYRIVVIEKAGYGYSDDTDVSRNIDTMIYETRKALKLANITGKYILVPHSMSGIEATYWAYKYPEEIEAICAIDIGTSEYYVQMEEKTKALSNFKNTNEIEALAIKLGLHRLPFVYNELKSNIINGDDWQIQKAMFFRNALCEAVFNEGAILYSNIQKVQSNNTMHSNIPMITFISSQMQEVYMSNASINWKEILENFTSQFKNGKSIYVNSSHMIHTDMPEFLANEIDKYLQENL